MNIYVSNFYYFIMLQSHSYMITTFASKAVCHYISTSVEKIFKLAWITDKSCQIFAVKQLEGATNCLVCSGHAEWKH